MADMVVIDFVDERMAFQVGTKLQKLGSERLVHMEKAVVVSKDREGKIKLHQAADLTAAGPMGDTFWTLLNGMIFCDPQPGNAVDSGTGFPDILDFMIHGRSLKELGENIAGGASAIYVVAHKAFLDQVMASLQDFRGQLQEKSFLTLNNDETQGNPDSP